MSIQAVNLETGETIIGDIQEVIDKEANESLGYKIENPFVLNISYETPLGTDDQPVEGGEGTDAKIDFTPWCPLSSAREFRVERDFCRVIYDAHGNVVEMYINTVAHWNEHNMHSVTVDEEKTIVTTAAGDSPFSGMSENADEVARGGIDDTDPNTTENTVIGG